MEFTYRYEWWMFYNLHVLKKTALCVIERDVKLNELAGDDKHFQAEQSLKEKRRILLNIAPIVTLSSTCSEATHDNENRKKVFIFLLKNSWRRNVAILYSFINIPEFIWVMIYHGTH